jgi:hypothetical protein
MKTLLRTALAVLLLLGMFSVFSKASNPIPMPGVPKPNVPTPGGQVK